MISRSHYSLWKYIFERFAAILLFNFGVSSAFGQSSYLQPTIGPSAVVEARLPTRSARLEMPGDSLPIGADILVDLRSPEIWFQDLVDRQLLDDPREIKDSTLLALLDRKKKEAEAITDAEKKAQAQKDVDLWWQTVRDNRWRNQVEEWLGKLYLIIDGRPFKELTPVWVNPWPWEEWVSDDKEALLATRKFARFHTLRYQLRKSDGTREHWLELLRGSGVMDRPVTISVGFDRPGPNDRVLEMLTEVTPNAKQQWQRVAIETAPTSKLKASAVLLVTLLGLLIWLAVSSNLLRDTTAPIKPSGQYPFSLGLCQMAFWLMVVGAAWLLIWVITGDYNSLSDSELALIGISASTGLGAVLINQVTPPNRPSPLTAAELQAKQPAQIAVLRVAAETALANAQTNLATQRSNTVQMRGQVVAGTIPQAALDTQIALEKQAQSDVDREELRVDELKDREAFFKPFGRIRSFFLDLLRERESVSFHRFQMLAWTLLLGLIFVFTVGADLSMPKFNSTLLLLLGISNGTYLGFKWPEAKKES